MLRLAQTGPGLDEFFADPTLTIACVLLLVVSIGWLIVSRLVARNLRRAAERGLRSPNVDVVRPPRDIWKSPP